MRNKIVELSQSEVDAISGGFSKEIGDVLDTVTALAISGLVAAYFPMPDATVGVKALVSFATGMAGFVIVPAISKMTTEPPKLVIEKKQ